MDSPTNQPKKIKDIAFAKKETYMLQALHESLNQKIEDIIDFLAQNFNNTVRRIESGKGRSSKSHYDLTSRRSDVRCYECEGGDKRPLE